MTLKEVLDVLTDCVEFLDNYVDVDDGGDGTFIPNRAMSLTQRVDAVMTAVQREHALSEHRIEIATRAYDRLALCPDHRDKASGRCIVCTAEERTRVGLQTEKGR
jgi:hypothetical protein